MNNKFFRYLRAIRLTLNWFWKPAPSEHGECHPLGIGLAWDIAKTVCDLDKETK